MTIYEKFKVHPDEGARLMIVTRHPATVGWLREKFPELREAPVFGEVKEEDVKDAFVFGVLPMHLACLCRQYVAVEFSGQPPRGQEYDRAAMEAAGVRVTPYAVLKGTVARAMWHFYSDGYYTYDPSAWPKEV